MNYNIKHTVTKQDYLAFVMNHIFINFFKIGNLILFIGSVGYLLLTPLLTGSFTFFYVGIGIVVLIIGGVFYVRYNAAKNYDKDPSAFNMEYIIDDNGFSAITNDGQRKMIWADFYSVKETNKHLFIYVTQHQGLLLNKETIGIEATGFIKQQLQSHMTNTKNIKLQNK